MTRLTAPLAERAEFASPAWIEVASTFLRERRAADLSEPYVAALELTNPPPHLSGDERIGYVVTFDSSETTIESGFADQAAWSRRADYNALLPFAWIVRRQPGGADRLEREYERLFGAAIDEPKVVRPMPPSVAAILAELHDFMAVRTINNPNIEHRAAGLGIADNLRDLDTDGYTVLNGAFSDAFADELREETHRNHAGRDEGASFRATMLLKRGRIWEEAAIHPWVLTVVEYLMGRGALMYQSDTIVKTTGQETHPGLHADYDASRITEPFPDYCVEGTAVWAIDDFHREHGPTCILPGSFRKGCQVPPGTGQEGTKLIEMDQGSIAFWHGAIWHGSTPRTAPGRRTSLHNAYSRSFIRPLERYDDIDQAIVDRNPPVFSTLCGLDDAFGKSGLDGADFERLRYAADQGFASSTPPAALEA